MDLVQLASEALVSLGANPIESFDDDTAEGRIAKTLTDTVVKATFSLHPWRFAIGSVQLARDVEAPEGIYEASYSLPAGVARVISVRVDDFNIEFDRADAKILCDASIDELVVAEVVRVIDPDFYPPAFAALIVANLQMKFCRPVTGEAPDTAMAREAAMALTNAKTGDSQGRTQRKIPLGRLSAAVAGARR